MKEILFQEIKKNLSVINNNEIKDDIKILKELEKNKIKIRKKLIHLLENILKKEHLMLIMILLQNF